MTLQATVVELYYKSDEFGDPMINHFHVKAMNMATDEEIHEIERQALKVNEIMRDYLKTKKITLVDFKLEFGRDKNGAVVLADEISPDNCHFQ